LGNPGGNIVLNGTSKRVNYLFQIIRTGPRNKEHVSKAFALDPATGESLELPVQDEVASLPEVTDIVGFASPGI
jgi:hypothetical protein